LTAAAKRWRPTICGAALHALTAIRPMPVGVDAYGQYFITLPGRRRTGSDDDDDGDEPNDGRLDRVRTPRASVAATKPSPTPARRHDLNHRAGSGWKHRSPLLKQFQQLR
jgi:hypothetical protein